MIPIEVLPVDAALATGAIASSSWAAKRPTVARQPARAARAVVLEGAGKGKVLALALLGKPEATPEGALKLDVAPASQAWCEFGTFMSAPESRQEIRMGRLVGCTGRRAGLATHAAPPRTR